MERTRGWLAALAAVTVAAMVLAACSSGSGGDKAGGDADRITLRIGTDDGPGRPAADQIDEFARRVEELSEGRIRIEPVWHAAGEGVDDWDQAVARLVVAGDLDMGMIPARAWDTEGVLSLRALQAPFLVTSDELVARIVTSDPADEMLSGLEPIGITGLVLLPEGLRHVFAFGDPLLSPADFKGKQIRAGRSEMTSAVFEALGATADDFGADDAAVQEGIRNGTIAGAESSFALAAGTLPASTTVVGNMTFFPKVNSLVVNTDAFDELTEGQQQILRDAANDIVGWAVSTTPSDVDLAEQYCANGGRIVLADEAGLEAMRAAVQPVYAELEQDETTKAMIDEIETLRQDLGPTQTAIAPCGPETNGEATAGDGGSESAFPEGVYRMEVSVEFLMEAGVDEATAYHHAGIYTMTFRDGRFVGEDVNAVSHERSVGRGVYCVEQGRVSFGAPADPPTCGDFLSARWTLDGDQLRLLDVQYLQGSDLLIQTLFGGQPWTKIG
jgi:TRAP-type C4-dicarboxylate transport system substrate-binding protein